ncbi:MAG: hypothetical protein AB9866_05980 [Syntrophobacteraceae bacterium]
MEYLSKLFEGHASLGGVFQIGLDILILGLLAAVFVVKRPRVSEKDHEVMKSFEKIIEETGAISREFEANLEKRQSLLQQISMKLDQRIQEAQGLCIRLEQLSVAETERLENQKSSISTSRSKHTDQQKVLILAKKGLNASEIAKSLKRPIGEIELILDLHKIAS